MPISASFLVGCAFVIGACVGSFLNVCIYRLPRDISIISPRSYCPNCGASIPWFRNLPLITWFLQRGKAACCGAEFSIRYWIIEAITAITFAVLVYYFSLPIALAYAVFMSLLIIGFFTDLDLLMIPDSVTIGGFFAGLIASLFLPELHNTSTSFQSLQQSALGAALGSFILGSVAWLGKQILKKEAMGMGDVKLMACLGAFLGWQATLFCITVGSFLGSLVGIGFLILRRKKWGSHLVLPFGPPLMIAALIWIGGGKQLWANYWATLLHL